MNYILFKVYGSASITVAAVLLFLCILLGYDVKLSLLVMRGALVISLPSVVSLHLILWLLQRIRVSKIAAWMMLMSLMPLLQCIPAFLLVNYLPGNRTDLVGLGILSGYAGVLSQGISISELFNSFLYETE